MSTQAEKLQAAEKNAPGHLIAEYEGIRSFLLECSCGWTENFRRENALARASKIFSAKLWHLRGAAKEKP